MKNRKISKIISVFIIGIVILLVSTQVNATEYYEFFKGDFEIVDAHLIPKAGNFTCIQRGAHLSPNLTIDRWQLYPVRI